MESKNVDQRMAALVLEVERRKKLPGQQGYSYGRLIADTTLEERDALAEKYKKSRRKKVQTKEHFVELDEAWETDDALVAI